MQDRKEYHGQQKKKWGQEHEGGRNVESKDKLIVKRSRPRYNIRLF